jgi:hypothetical protein
MCGEEPGWQLERDLGRLKWIMENKDVSAAAGEG